MENVSYVSIGLSSFGGVPWVLVKFRFFLIYFMRTFAVEVEGGKCLMSSIVRLVKVVKWPFLTSWSKVLFTRLKRDEWYHLARSLLLLADRALSAASCCWLDGLLGLLFRLTCHMTDVVDLMPFSTVSPSLTALR